jgi:antitoxin VapB
MAVEAWAGSFATPLHLNLQEHGRYSRLTPDNRRAILPVRSLTDMALMGYTMPYTSISEPLPMRRTAKIFMTNRSQAVRLPKDFQFKVDEVFIEKDGEKVILSPRPTTWADYFKNAPVASAEFMENIEDLPAQERAW